MKKYFLKTPAVVESKVRNDSLDNCQAAVEQVDISAATVVPERPAVEEFDETNDINGNDPYHHNSDDDDDIGPDNGVASTPVAEVTEEPVKVENKDEAVTQPPTPPAELHEDGDVESSTNSVESTSKYVRFAVTPSHTTGRGLGTVTERLTREGNSAAVVIPASKLLLAVSLVCLVGLANWL